MSTSRATARARKRRQCRERNGARVEWRHDPILGDYRVTIVTGRGRGRAHGGSR